MDDEEEKDKIMNLISGMDKKGGLGMGIAESEMIYDPKYGGEQPKDSLFVDAVAMSEFDPTKGC